MSLRRARSTREKFTEAVRVLDAFPKVDPDAQQTTESGGAVTLVTAVIIALLVFSEFMYYRTIDIKYTYYVDPDIHREMFLTLDMTVAMKCDHLGVDYIDVAGNSSNAGSKYLKMEPAYFELTENQLEWRKENMPEVDDEASEQTGLDSLERFLIGAVDNKMPAPAGASPEVMTPSCRIHGAMPINKVAANFHITGGKSIYHDRGHSHMSALVPPEALNFSHRIDRLSFSDEAVGVHTLDGNLRVTEDRFEMYQYFMKIVPTSTKRLDQPVPFRSNQYSVTEQARNVEPSRGSQGIPGVYFKYDLESMSVHVAESRRSWTAFLVRLCGIAGGVFATSGMLHQTITNTARSYYKTSAIIPRSSESGPSSPR
jgi:hypothetical protein